MSSRNVAVIFAGGTGERMTGCVIPKQFLEWRGKPVLAYTLDQFQRHEEIDGIMLVVPTGWIDYCTSMMKKYAFDKIKAIVEGGPTSQASIRNGLEVAGEYYASDDIVLIHDGVRPFIDAQTISSCIRAVHLYGNAVIVSPQMETIMVADSQGEIYHIVDRSRCFVARAPQCFYLRDILSVHRQALKENHLSFIDCASMMEYYGYKLHLEKGPDENIKITTSLDFYVFRTIMQEKVNEEL